MKLGFIKPNYPNERRVALLPKDIINFNNEIYIETGFGSSMDITDEEYAEKGCTIVSHEDIYKNCEAVFSLKLIQESDYKYIRKGQIIVGWTHPMGGGSEFLRLQANTKDLIVVDLDNIAPKIYYKKKKRLITDIPRNFIVKNSINAGYASTMHALMAHGIRPVPETKVAILAPGNVSQGAFQAVSQFNCNTRMFYRKTMPEFKSLINEFDIIINGIEVLDSTEHIINLEEVRMCKDNCLIIDAAADAGNAIEGTYPTSHLNPIVSLENVYFYCVNNSPSIFFRKASKDISESFSKYVYKDDIRKYLDLAKSM